VRILVTTNLYPPVAFGGYEVECAGVVDHLRERHEVLVLTSDRDATPVPAQEHVRRVLPFVEYTKRASFAAPAFAVRAARATRRALADFSPELAYTWNGSQIPHTVHRVLDGAGIPIAYRICEHWFSGLYRDDQFMRHLYPGDRGARRVWAALIRAVNRHPALRLEVESAVPAAICWNSEAMKRLNTVPATVTPALEDLIYPATAQSSRFEGLERSPAREPTIAYIGRVGPEKGVEVAYRALALLRDRHQLDARLVVAGPWEERMRGTLAGLAAQLGVEDAIEGPGQLDTAGLSAVLARAHAVVVPSTWQEPAPLICVEAAIARVPIVASRVGGIPELVPDREQALLFEPGDADGCADALAETLRDEAAASARVAAAYAHARELTIEPYLKATDRFLDAALEVLRK
jgi:glycosyltransferase involved in cell wall biosynthesis